MATIGVRATFGHAATSLEGVRASLGIPRPVTVRQLAEQWNRDVVFDEPLVTSDGVPLGGHHTLTVHRDGRYRYQGHFRATGLFSYDVSLLTTLGYAIPVPGSGQPAVAQVAFAARGRVNGANDFGDEVYRWDRPGASPLLASEWQEVRKARLHRQLEYDADWFGPAGDVLAFLALAAAAGATFGAAGVAVVLTAEAIELLDLRELAVPGLIGILVAGAAVFVLGPGALLPAFLIGMATGAELIGQRPLRGPERRFAEGVFGATLPLDRILLTNLVGIGNRPFTCPGPANTILLNLGMGYDDPLNYTGFGDAPAGVNAPGGLLVHELVHAWQIEHATFAPEYFCRAVATAAATAGGDMSNYSYGSAGPRWSSFNSEQQASIVEHWFAGSRSGDPRSPQRAFRQMLEDDQGPNQNPYYRYIRDHLRANVT